MKKIILSAITLLLLGSFAQAQTSGKSTSKLDLTGRAADHFMVQFGADTWNNRPDSINTSGFSRHFNIYFMYDKPFRGNQHFSLAYGGGISTSNIFFDDHTYVDVKSSAPTLPFRKLDANANYFTKQKVTTIYLDAPVELRYYSKPANPAKSWKLAAGVKLGTLLKAYSKAKNYVRADGSSVYGQNYVEKQYSKRFFNGYNMTLTGRVGYGLVSLDMGYQVTPVLRDGFGPTMNKVSFGVTISGL
jgi:hypothetical protein